MIGTGVSFSQVAKYDVSFKLIVLFQDSFFFPPFSFLSAHENNCYCVCSTYWLKLIGLQAQDFRNVGTKMRRKMWLQNMKVKLIVLGILIALILIIILSVCHGFNCGK